MYRRIAADLHDGPAQELVNLVLRLESATRKATRDPQTAADEIAQSVQAARRALSELRRFMAELRPANSDPLELLPALRHYAADLRERFGFPIELAVQGDLDDLPSDVQVNVYRILQEALRNAVRHASPQSVSVIITRDASGLTAEVRDDGAGFDPDAPVAVSSSPGMGIACMKERAAVLGGNLQVISRPGAGTTVRFYLEGDKLQVFHE
ncbi:MAG: sensor histidine kinase [Armatimonadota bacterium]